jgi:hypothetical protein
MAYSDFTLSLLEERLGVFTRETVGAFEGIPPMQPTEVLTTLLARALPVVLGANKEKARSELLIAPILLEVRELCQQQVSLFSGKEFNVDRKQGLGGYCDFLLSRSPHQMELYAPVVSIVEAKHEDLTEGVAQCLAAMYAAKLFNENRGKTIETIYGVTTSGTTWRFLRLTGSHAEADITEYHITEIARILGILVFMVS